MEPIMLDFQVTIKVIILFLLVVLGGFIFDR